MEPLGQPLPLVGQVHHGGRVQNAEAEEVVELQAGPIQLPLVHAVGVVQRVALGRQDGQVLDVSPRQVLAADEEAVGTVIIIIIIIIKK